MSKKKHNKIDVPKPLKLVQHIRNHFPAVWTTYDSICMMISNMGDYNAMFPNRKLCSYIVEEAAKHHHYKIENESAEAHILYALGAWRRYKEVFSVDKDLADIILSATENIKIPTEILRNAPFPAFYVEIPDSDAYKENGFICIIDTIANEVEFFTVNHSGYVIAIPLPLDENLTIDEAIKKSVGTGNPHYNIDAHDTNVEFVKRAIQIVLYICAVNADVIENPQQKSIMRKPTSTSRSTDTLKEIRKWDVGYKVGRTIRSISQNSDIERPTHYKPHSTTSPKRPHARRGHFHHFWIGSKTNGDRKLVLKWVAPMFINTKIDTEIPANITKIEL